MSRRKKLAYLILFGGAALLATVASVRAVDPRAATAEPHKETLQERRQRVEALSPEAKRELLYKQERFDHLTSQDQERLRQVHEELSADPAADELRAVLERYCEWLKSLPLDVRAELRSMEPQERIARIRELRTRQAQKDRREKTRQDFRTTIRWMEDYAARHEDEILSGPGELLRPQLDRLNDTVRRRRLMTLLSQQWLRDEGPTGPALAEEDFTNLKESLSSETRAKIEEQEAPRDQWRALVDHLFTEARNSLPRRERDQVDLSSADQRWGYLVGRDSAPQVGTRQLWTYFHERLSDEEKERLRDLPPEEVLRVLRARFEREFHGRRGPPRHVAPDEWRQRVGPRRGGPPGERDGRPRPGDEPRGLN